MIIINMNLANISDFAAIAKNKLPTDIYNFFDGGSTDEVTLKRNENKIKEILLLPRILRPVRLLNTAINLFDYNLAVPFISAPIAFQSLVHNEGELATAKAINTAQSGMIVSTMSSISLEKIANEYPKSFLCFQLYIYKDRSLTKDLILRAEMANYKAIVITIDTPIMGRRYKDIRSQFKLPVDCVASNLPHSLKEELYKNGDASTIKTFTDKYFENAISWEDIEWVKSITKLPLILKGIMHPADAKDAIAHNIDAIIISNHGGRQLDCMPSTIEVLNAIAQEVNQRIPILVDGGFRNGSDVFKAIALGADCVCIGRPIIWGLCANGDKGVLDILNHYTQELKETMILCGCSSINEIKRRGRELILHTSMICRS